MIGRHPWAIASAFAIACAVAIGVHATHARYDLSYRTMAPHSTPEFAEFEEFTEIFGRENDTYLIAFRSDPLLTNPNLRLIEHLTRALEALPHTRSVVSLTNVDDIVGHDGALEVTPFVERIPYPADRFAALGEHLRNDPVVGGNLISKDGTTTVIVVRIPESQMEFDERFAHFDAVEAILSDARPTRGPTRRIRRRRLSSSTSSAIPTPAAF